MMAKLLPTGVRAKLGNALPWVVAVYAVGIILRVIYTLRIQPPEAFISSDMYFYVTLATRLASSTEPLMPWDVTHPLGYPALLAFMIGKGGSFAPAIDLQIVVSCLVPAAVGLLGAAAYGRKTGLLATVFASVYFPFVDFGALFLSEIHFIFWLALAFAAFFAARRARRLSISLALAAGGGFALSVAASFKSVALPAALAFFVVEGIAAAAEGPAGAWRARLRPWGMRVAVVAVGAAPLLGVMANVCTRANHGHFCVTGNKAASDFLLGHYGRLSYIQWADDRGHGFHFGSPGAYLRNYGSHFKVPFTMTDSAANADEALRWIRRNPGEAIVLSTDHVFDTFFGVAYWPGYENPTWTFAHLSQYVFIVFLFGPLIFACAPILRRGARAALTSRTALVLAPIAALIVTVAFATGEVRYRIPFDIFFITAACAYATKDLARIDLPPRSA
jgi:4-amino-4-deoxy-L-arabinose transferase-like glycosyltransferase